MESNKPILNITHKADAVELSAIRDRLKKYLQDIEIDMNDISTIVIAVNEACMNIIQHASGGDYQGNIDIYITADDTSLVIKISDDAECASLDKFNPVCREELKPGGLGLYIINEIMDNVVYKHKENNTGNIIIMNKNLRVSNGI